jgi:hypothetical protein
MRVFSDIKIRVGPDTNGLYTIQRVPILYGDPSSVVAQLIKGASENTLLPTPMFSAYIESIKMVPERRQDTMFVGKVSTIERQFDPVSNTYGNGPGVRQDVERYMPVPCDITFKLDVWTSNTTTKLQLFEQIYTVFNPSVQLQQNDNLLDWTSIFELWMEDFVWTNRSIPQGANDDRDVMSFKFKIQGWINPPAKIKRSTLIAEIVSNVFYTDVQNVQDMVDNNEYDPFSCLGINPVQIITTEGDYMVRVRQGVSSDEIVLMNKYGEEDPALSWADLIQKYGQITPNITKLRLKLDANIEVFDFDIIGTIVQDPSRQNVLLYTPDLSTLPGNTLPPISEIIDPVEVWPGQGLPVASAGQRYLLTSAESGGKEPAFPPGVVTSPWGSNIVAYPNDIIEFNGGSWRVVFDSRNSTNTTRVVNNSNGIQYTFDGTGWAYTYYGEYAPGYWRIDNIIQAPNGTTLNQYE